MSNRIRWVTGSLIVLCLGLGLVMGAIQRDTWRLDDTPILKCPTVSSGQAELNLEPVEGSNDLSLQTSVHGDFSGVKPADPPADSKMIGLEGCLGLDAGSFDTVNWTAGHLSAEGSHYSGNDIEPSEPPDKYHDLVVWYRPGGLSLSLGVCRDLPSDTACPTNITRMLQLRLPKSWNIANSSASPISVEQNDAGSAVTFRLHSGGELRIDLVVPAVDTWKLTASSHWLLWLGLWPGGVVTTSQFVTAMSLVAMALVAGFLSVIGGQRHGRRLAVDLWCLAGAFASLVAVSALIVQGTGRDYAVRFSIEGMAWALLNLLLWRRWNPKTVGILIVLGIVPSCLFLIPDSYYAVGLAATLATDVTACSLAILIAGATYRIIRTSAASARLTPERAPFWSRTRAEQGLVIVMAAMAAVSLGAPLSAALDYSNRASSVLSAVDDAGSALARACLVLGPVLVVGVLALQFGRTEGWSIRGFAARRRRITCLLFAIAVATPTQSVFDAIPWPGWIITLIAVLWLTRRMEPAASPMDRGALLDAASVDFALRSDLEKLDATPPTTEAEAAERRSKRHDVIEKTRPDVARQFLACGPRANWASNARFGAVLGLWVGALPIAFFAFTAVRTLGRPSGNYLASDLLLVVLAVLLNTVFWAVAGFAVTGLYSSLPGRTGPTKAVALWGIWLASAIAAELVAAFPWAPDPTEWVYVALELLLGLVGISVAHDLASVRAVDGNWRRLLEVYNVHRLRDLSRYLIPLVLAVVGLVQQIASGSAADIVQAALDGISSALNPAVR